MLQSQVEALFAQPKPSYTNDDFEVFHRFIAALNSGEIRSAEPDAASPTGWRVNAWVKQAPSSICLSTHRSSPFSINPRFP
jgi:2,3,4,5-tetrahydropyridine-2-carboxylate N-succinyltransferase